MPRRDGTGPMGMGPLTGRGAGICAGYAALRHVYPGLGCGLHLGRGRGLRRMSYAAYNSAFKPPVDEKDYLSKEAEVLKNRLLEVDKRLKEIDADND